MGSSPDSLRSSVWVAVLCLITQMRLDAASGLSISLLEPIVCSRASPAAGVPWDGHNAVDSLIYCKHTSVPLGQEATNLTLDQATRCLKEEYLVSSLFLSACDDYKTFSKVARKVQCTLTSPSFGFTGSHCLAVLASSLSHTHIFLTHLRLSFTGHDPSPLGISTRIP